MTTTKFSTSLLTVTLCAATLACGPTDETPPSAASETPPESTATTETAAPEETTADADLGTLTFEVADGPHAGTYGGALSDDSTVSAGNFGGQSSLSLRLIHELEDGSTVSLAGGLPMDGEPAPGTYTLDGNLITIGYLPGGVSRDPKYFSVNTAAGSGSLTIDSIDLSAGAIAGSFTATQGELTIEGTYELEGR
jgi:hypothetical protein